MYLTFWTSVLARSALYCAARLGDYCAVYMVVRLHEHNTPFFLIEQNPIITFHNYRNFFQSCFGYRNQGSIFFKLNLRTNCRFSVFFFPTNCYSFRFIIHNFSIISGSINRKINPSFAISNKILSSEFFFLHS